jgi:hypothetical protein
MKKLTTIAIALMMLITSCEEQSIEPKYQIEQGVARYDNEAKFYTFIWKETRILKAWSDNIETATDSLKQARKIQAQKFIDKCKQLEE